MAARKNGTHLFLQLFPSADGKSSVIIYNLKMAAYDVLAGGRGNVAYTTASPATTFPDADMYNVFGPIWAPRVYGKDLTSFEVASSGTIAIMTDAFAAEV